MSTCVSDICLFQPDIEYRQFLFSKCSLAYNMYLYYTFYILNETHIVAICNNGRLLKLLFMMTALCVLFTHNVYVQSTWLLKKNIANCLSRTYHSVRQYNTWQWVAGTCAFGSYALILRKQLRTIQEKCTVVKNQKVRRRTSNLLPWGRRVREKGSSSRTYCVKFTLFTLTHFVIWNFRSCQIKAWKARTVEVFFLRMRKMCCDFYISWKTSICMHLYF